MPGRIDVLFVCTANQCRSPMAAALLADRLPQLRIVSMGIQDWPGPATERAQRAVARYGLDLSSHESRALTDEAITAARLVVGLERNHVREVVARQPAAVAKTFTLKEIVRRGEAVGGRRKREALTTWMRRAAAGRTVTDLLGDGQEDDIIDPVGRSQRAHDACAAELADLVERLARVAFQSN